MRRTPDAGRYLLTDVVASGPPMFDYRIAGSGRRVEGTDQNPIAELERRAAAAGLHTATLDECSASPRSDPPPHRTQGLDSPCSFPL